MPTLQLTPLIDVMIVIVFFLLLNFQASGECVCPGGIVIREPIAEHLERLERAPVVAISADESPVGGVVTLDGTEVATTRELLEEETPDWKIARLTERLEVSKHNWKLTNPAQVFPGELIVHADRTASFKVIKKVLYSVGLAGYGTIQMVARLDQSGPRRAENGSPR